MVLIMEELTFHNIPLEDRTKVIEKAATFVKLCPEIVFAFLFGSFLCEPLFRDIDIGIFVKNLTTSSYHFYEGQLAQQIERHIDLPIPVEVKIINEAPASFSFSVVSGKLLFTRNEEFLTVFMTDIAKRYLDFAPLRHRYLKEAIA